MTLMLILTLFPLNVQVAHQLPSRLYLGNGVLHSQTHFETHPLVNTTLTLFANTHVFNMVQTHTVFKVCSGVSTCTVFCVYLEHSVFEVCSHF